MNWTYVRILSWHVVLTPNRELIGYRTLCGRYAIGPPVDTLPAGKSCESCLRSVTRAADRQP